MSLKNCVPAIVLGTLLSLPATAHAQFDKTWKDWFGHIGGGYTLVQGDASGVLKNGWNINGGVTYKPGDWPLGIVMELGFNDFTMTNDALDFFESSGGDASVTSLTVGAIWAAKTSGNIGFNLQAGIGGYYVQARLKEPGYVCGPICDPSYWWWCYWGCVPGSVITDKQSTTEFGYNFGVAVTFELSNDAVIYLEARYHWIDTKVSSTFMPISIGYRW